MNGVGSDLVEMQKIERTACDYPEIDVGICAPFTLLADAARTSPSLLLGAQDCHSRPSGAFTGEVSVSMLDDVGVRAVILGHSERRHSFAETSSAVREKAEAVLSAGMMAIICVGESKEARSAGEGEQSVLSQLAQSLPNLNGTGELIVAYEPIWAIGCGQAAPRDIISDMHDAIRAFLTNCIGDLSEKTRIIYGGSCVADNCADLFRIKNVDGLLVGGASLRAATFIPIIRQAAGVLVFKSAIGRDVMAA
jgi:triosephosphate isomerase